MNGGPKGEQTWEHSAEVRQKHLKSVEDSDESFNGYCPTCGQEYLITKVKQLEERIKELEAEK